MRSGAPSSVLASSAQWDVQVASWQGTSLRAASVPIVSGVWSADASRQVPDSLDLRVPRGAVDEWVPGADTSHPLARYGQTLTATVVVTDVTGQSSWRTQVGQAVIQEWSADDPGDVQVTAAGVLQRVADDRLPAPTSPAAGATLAGEFRRLISGGIPVEIAGLTDRAAASSFTWDEDRLAALYDIADAWPALLAVTARGGVRLSAPLPATFPGPVLTWTDGEGGTVVSAPRSDTRDDAYNAVVARGSSASTTAAMISAEVKVTSGPMATTGPYGVVRRFYSSPLLTTTGQAELAAQSILATAMRPSRTVTVTCAPDPRVELHDPVRAVRGGQTFDGWVVAYRLPLTVRDGDMSVTIGLGG